MNFATKKKILKWCFALEIIWLVICLALFVFLVCFNSFFVAIMGYVYQPGVEEISVELAQYHATLFYVGLTIFIFLITFDIVFYFHKINQTNEVFHSKKQRIFFIVWSCLQILLMISLINGILGLIISIRKDDGLPLKIKQKKEKKLKNIANKKNKKKIGYNIPEENMNMFKEISRKRKLGEISQEYYVREVKKLENINKDN